MSRLSQSLKQRLIVVAFIWVVSTSAAFPQSSAQSIQPLLKGPILADEVLRFQLRHYLLGRIANPPVADSLPKWRGEAERIRARFLKEIFHGWPEEWVNSPTKFEETSVIETTHGYRIRKFRYQVVPGFTATALLYEPTNLQGKVPAILNVHGHEISLGKATEYKQKRCINFAKRGMLALSLEWIGTGELNVPGDEHWFGAHLDLVGMNGVGLFYLAMRRGLDFLYDHPHVDRGRIGLTGLSGGGWQTIVLGALDERVKVIIPVAGYASLQQRLESRDLGSIGDIEQNATDLYDGYDYSHLTALLAPRPALLIYNAEDDCCVRAPLAKPLIFDAIRPIFALYGKESAFQWHENRDPGTHNYQLDNRQQAYRFFDKFLNWPGSDTEIDSDSEIKRKDELDVGFPEGNLTILGLAREVGRAIHREPVPDSKDARKQWTDNERTTLGEVLRYKPVSLARPWRLFNTKDHGVETLSYVFEMNNGLSANAVWLKAISSPESATATIVLDDRGKKCSGAVVSDRVNRGEQVLALDLLFFGDSTNESECGPLGPKRKLWNPLSIFVQMFDAVGDRGAGLEVAQLIEISRWLSRQSGASRLRIEASGFRSQTIALLAAAMKPSLFSEIVIRKGMPSLGYLLEKPVDFEEAPDLFCLDLYKDFDLDRLEVMAGEVRFSHAD